MGINLQPPLCQEQRQRCFKQSRYCVSSAPLGQIQERLGPSSGSKAAHKTDIYTCCQSTFTHLASEDVEMRLFQICRGGANIPNQGLCVLPSRPLYLPLDVRIIVLSINAKKLHLDSTNLYGACAVGGAKGGGFQ